MPPVHIYPRGTYQKVIFYSRGGDIYKEPEYTEEELRACKEKYNATYKKFQIVKNEYEKVLDRLNSTEKYALKIAQNLGDDSNITTENAQLVTEINDLHDEIEKTRNEIEEIRKKTNPTGLSSLLREYVMYFPEFELRASRLSSTDRNIDSAQVELCKIYTSQKYQKSILSAVERDVSIKCQKNIKQHLTSVCNTINGGPSEINSKITNAINNMNEKKSPILNSFQQLIGIKMQLEEILLQKELAATHRREIVRAAFNEIYELNDIIKYFGEEPIDIEEVKRECDYEQIEEEAKANYQKEKQVSQQANDKPFVSNRNRKK